MMNPKISILRFINNFSCFGEDVIKLFTEGCCYWFAFILLNRFKVIYDCKIFYNQVLNHFACKINENLFDITGLIEDDGNWKDWEEYCNYEPLDSSRVKKYCILKY